MNREKLNYSKKANFQTAFSACAFTNLAGGALLAAGCVLVWRVVERILAASTQDGEPQQSVLPLLIGMAILAIVPITLAFLRYRRTGKRHEDSSIQLTDKGILIEKGKEFADAYQGEKKVGHIEVTIPFGARITAVASMYIVHFNDENEKTITSNIVIRKNGVILGKKLIHEGSAYLIPKTYDPMKLDDLIQNYLHTEGSVAK